MFNECRLALRQAQPGYAVGANSNSENFVTVLLHRAHARISNGTAGAMYEWTEQLSTDGPIFTGGYKVQWNSVNPKYDYRIGPYSSDAAARQWRYTAKSLELHIGYYEQLTGTAENNNQITTRYVEILDLSNAVITNRGIHPVGGRDRVGRGFVNIASPILHRGPMEWEII